MAARYIVDSLGPSDMAAVVFPRDAGHTQDFTSDRRKLLAAIDQFDPREPDMSCRCARQRRAEAAATCRTGWSRS